MTAPHGMEPRRLPGPLLLVLWFALVSGIIEGIYRLFQVTVQHKIILLPIHVVWMAPLANIVWIGIPTLLLMALHRISPRVFSLGLMVGVMATVAFLPIVLLYTAMAKVAALILAIGLGYQAARTILKHPAGFGRLVRRSVVPLVLVVAVAGASIGVVRRVQERRALARLPGASPGVPNVLLIIWDTARSQNLSVYGYDRPTTPFLAAFAREGARFDHALSMAPWTLPSHGVMFTGRLPRELIVTTDDPLIDSFPTLAGALAARGYATGGFVANMAFGTREHGLSRDFSHYEDYPLTLGTVVKASRLGAVIMDQEFVRERLHYWNQLDRKSAADVNDQFLNWVDRSQARPFFAFLNYFDAHRPYIAVEPFKSRFVRDSSGRFRPRLTHVSLKDASSAEVRWMQDNYDANLAYLDQQVERLLEELKRRGLLENTLVIVSSDHGEHFGDHGRLGHMNSLYRQLLQVPLIMRLPGRIPAGTVVTTPVTLGDLPRTILDLAGVKDSAGIPGASLTRYWNGTIPDSSANPEPVFSEFATRKAKGPYSLVAWGYHYIAWQGQTQPAQMYDFVRDSLELQDVINRPEVARLLPGFQALSVQYVGQRALEHDSTRMKDGEVAAPGQ